VGNEWPVRREKSQVPFGNRPRTKAVRVRNNKHTEVSQHDEGSIPAGGTDGHLIGCYLSGLHMYSLWASDNDRLLLE
jgi:hypothetical protein